MAERKYCEISFVDMKNDRGRDVPGVTATCVDCGAETHSFGDGEGSIKRCMVLMRDVCKCPEASDSFFTCDELED